MSLYGSHGKFNAKPGERDNLVQYMLQAAESVRSLEGCLLYVVYTAPSDPHGVYITEVWTSKEAHEESLKLEGVRALISQVLPILDGPPEGMVLQPVGGKGI
jgi:quinol monooxygenase YgiN